jgi:hypothetical protein
MQQAKEFWWAKCGVTAVADKILTAFLDMTWSGV